jgi:hypothetical protein
MRTFTPDNEKSRPARIRAADQLETAPETTPPSAVKAEGIVIDILTLATSTPRPSACTWTLTL